MLNSKGRVAYIENIVSRLGPILVVLLVLCSIVELQAHGLRSPLNWRFGLLVARDLLLGVLMIGGAAFVCAGFVRDAHGLWTRKDGYSFLWRRLFGLSSFRPWLRVAGGRLKADDKSPLLRVGGPGSLVIHNDTAVILEKAGKLTRVVKTGFAELDAFEKVWDVVDLRPHRWVYDVSAMTKDGIPIICLADVTFQIDDEGQMPGEDEPFPATEQAIFSAVISKWIREADRSEDDQMFDWAHRGIIGMTEGALRDILATYSLDQIFGPAGPNQNHYRVEIIEKLKRELCKTFPALGLKVTEVEFGDIKIEDSITQSRIESWRASWRRWAKKREAEGEAEYLQYVESAKAQVEANRIKKQESGHVISQAPSEPLARAIGNKNLQNAGMPQQPSPLTPESRSKLRKNLINSFNESELRDLCFDMGADYETLPGQGKADKAREFIAYLERRSLISGLIVMLRALRPNVSWDNTPEAN